LRQARVDFNGHAQTHPVKRKPQHHQPSRQSASGRQQAAIGDRDGLNAGRQPRNPNELHEFAFFILIMDTAILDENKFIKTHKNIKIKYF
jgi:hypothetical protein